MSQQKNNLSDVDIDREELIKVKEYLIKYCYFSNSSTSDSLRNYTLWLLSECNNIALLKNITYLFDTYIMPFYVDKTNRTYFNKLRCYFMKFVLMLLIGETDSFIKVSTFYKLYPNMSFMAGLQQSPEWQSIAKPLILKAKEAYFDIHNV